MIEGGDGPNEVHFYTQKIGALETSHRKKSYFFLLYPQQIPKSLFLYRCTQVRPVKVLLLVSTHMGVRHHVNTFHCFHYFGKKDFANFKHLPCQGIASVYNSCNLGPGSSKPQLALPRVKSPNPRLNCVPQTPISANPGLNCGLNLTHLARWINSLIDQFAKASLTNLSNFKHYT